MANERTPDPLALLGRLDALAAAVRARADGAVRWSLMIWCESPQLPALLPGSRFDSLYAGRSEVLVAGAFAPRGTAVPAEAD